MCRVSQADGRFVRLDLQFENRTSCLGVNATTCQAIKTVSRAVKKKGGACVGCASREADQPTSAAHAVQAVVESTLTDLATRAYFDIAELLWDTYNSTVYGWISSWLV